MALLGNVRVGKTTLLNSLLQHKLGEVTMKVISQADPNYYFSSINIHGPDVKTKMHFECLNTLQPRCRWVAEGKRRLEVAESCQTWVSYTQDTPGEAISHLWSINYSICKLIYTLPYKYLPPLLLGPRLPTNNRPWIFR